MLNGFAVFKISKGLNGFAVFKISKVSNGSAGFKISKVSSSSNARIGSLLAYEAVSTKKVATLVLVFLFT